MLKLFTRIACLCLLASSLVAQDHFSKAEPVHIPEDGQRWVQKTLKGLSLEEKVGQMLNVRYFTDFQNFSSTTYQQFRDQMQKYHLGSVVLTVHTDGPILLRNGPLEVAAVANQLQKDSKLPLLIAADFERGLDSRVSGTLAFPDAMAFGAIGDPARAERYGAIVAEESRAIGIHWNFFPVADVNSNPDNPIINTRSFGEDPQQVSDFVAAYIRGAHSAGMLVTAKHFPGHGDTATDSHLGLAQVAADRARLNSVELPPFRRAIAAGVDAIMVAHVTVPALDSNPNGVASVSQPIITGLLKQQLQFHGLVITDALDMAGLTRIYANNIGREAVDAFKAGNDVLLIPPDLDAAYRAVLAAVRSKEIPESRLDESVLKILKVKASLALNKARLVDLSSLEQAVGSPDHIAEGQQMADDAVTLVRQNGAVLPLKKTGTNNHGLPYQGGVEVRNRVVTLVLSDDVRLQAGRALEVQIKSRVPDANVIYTDADLAPAMAPEIMSAAQQAEKVVIAVFASPSAGRTVKVNCEVRGSASLPDSSMALLYEILKAAPRKTIVLAMGNPYLARDFPEVQNYLCTFSAAPVSELSAARALFGEIEIHGHLPVTIPGVAKRGAGITVQAEK